MAEREGSTGRCKIKQPKDVDKGIAVLGFEDGDLEQSGSNCNKDEASTWSECTHSSCLAYLWCMVWFHLGSTERQSVLTQIRTSDLFSITEVRECFEEKVLTLNWALIENKLPSSVRLRFSTSFSFCYNGETLCQQCAGKSKLTSGYNYSTEVSPVQPWTESPWFCSKILHWLVGES